MKTAHHLARHFKEGFYGPNMTGSNLYQQLEGVNWRQATTQLYDLNTIAILVYHIGYYVGGVLDVLKGGELTIRDKYSFDCPVIDSEESWQSLLEKTWREVDEFTALLQELSETQLKESFVDEKYGSYHRNMLGIIEHTHYHLGQIALIKKIVLKEESK